MITKRDFSKLKSITNDTCVSLYIPTEITGDYEKNRILWKKAINEAKERLKEERNFKPREIEDILEPAEELLNENMFWAHQSKGLVGFYSKEYNNYFHLSNVNDSIVSVHDDFYLYPLLKDITNNDRIFILAISKNETRFFEAVKDGIYPVRIHDVVVKNMDEALHLDEQNNSLQHHSGTATGNAQFHANSSSAEKEKIRTKQYLRRIDDGIMKIIFDEQVPLVLACVEEYYPMYKDISKYKYITNHLIKGNPENLTPTDFRKNVEPLFKEMHQQRLESFNETYNQKVSEGQVSNNLDEIEEMAKFKNIDTLLVCQPYVGQLDKAQRERFDDIIMNIIDFGGHVLTVNEKETQCKTLCAIQRFAMETSS